VSLLCRQELSDDVLSHMVVVKSINIRRIESDAMELQLKKLTTAVDHLLHDVKVRQWCLQLICIPFFLSNIVHVRL